MLTYAAEMRGQLAAKPPDSLPAPLMNNFEDGISGDAPIADP
jgi:hypothetical protein